MAARLDDPHHLFDALRHVWKRHNAELGSRYVEAIISELECVAIHDTCLARGKTFHLVRAVRSLAAKKTRACCSR